MLFRHSRKFKTKKPVESGEYDLRIIVKKAKSTKTDRYGCMLVCEIDGKMLLKLCFTPYGMVITKIIPKMMIQNPNDMWRRVKDFLRALRAWSRSRDRWKRFKGLEFTADLSYNDGMGTDENGKPVKVGQPKKWNRQDSVNHKKWYPTKILSITYLGFGWIFILFLLIKGNILWHIVIG